MKNAVASKVENAVICQLTCHELTVGSIYKLRKYLGSSIYSGINMKSKDEVAIKLERIRYGEIQMLPYEAQIAKKFSGEPGFPTVLFHGVEGDFNVMVCSLLGPNLATLFDFCDKKFSVANVYQIGVQLVKRLQVIHSKNMVHRNVKPENILTGIGAKSQTFYLIDFG